MFVNLHNLDLLCFKYLFFLFFGIFSFRLIPKKLMSSYTYNINYLRYLTTMYNLQIIQKTHLSLSVSVNQISTYRMNNNNNNNGYF